MNISSFFPAMVAVLLFCSGCQHPVSGVVGRVNGLDGMTESQVVADMGQPFRRDEFMASASAGKFWTGLKRIASRLQKEDVRIRELTWDRTNYLVTAWLHETNGTWTVLDTLKYGKNVKF